MRRGEIYDARLEPIEGSEQGGTRPVIIVSRKATRELNFGLNWLFCSEVGARKQQVSVA